MFNGLGTGMSFLLASQIVTPIDVYRNKTHGIPPAVNIVTPIDVYRNKTQGIPPAVNIVTPIDVYRN